MDCKVSHNLKIKIHKARIEQIAKEICQNPQIAVVYGGVCLETDVKAGDSPMWEEEFNLECAENKFEIVLMHKPVFFNKIRIGSAVISAETASGWFDVKNFYGKIATVKISVSKDPLKKERGLRLNAKINILNGICDKINAEKQKYAEKLEGFKKIQGKKGNKDSEISGKLQVTKNTDFEQENAGLTKNTEMLEKKIESQHRPELDSETIENLIANMNLNNSSRQLRRKYMKNLSQTPKNKPNLFSDCSSRLSDFLFTQPRSVNY